MRYTLAIIAALFFAGCSQPSADAAQHANAATPAHAAAATAPAHIVPATTTAPAGDYVQDPPHSSLIFRVNHMGFSTYTARFSNFDVRLHIDPAHPELAQLQATIPVSSLSVENPPDGFVAELLGDQFFHSAQFQQITFASTQVQMTSPRTARVTGNLTLHGVTRPVVLETTFNGGYPGMAMDPHARVGFSAHGSLRRSEFGMGYGIPAPGTTMGVGDQVDFQIETELTGPAFQQP